MGRKRHQHHSEDALAYRAIAARLQDAHDYRARFIVYHNHGKVSVWHDVLDDAVRLRARLFEVEQQLKALQNRDYIDIEPALEAFHAHLFEGAPLPKPVYVPEVWKVEIRTTFDQAFKHEKLLASRRAAIDFAQSIWKRHHEGEFIEPWVYDPDGNLVPWSDLTGG